MKSLRKNAIATSWIVTMIGDYINGFVERTKDGSFCGKVTIDGVTLPSIFGVYFQKGEDKYLWLRRKKILDYDFDTQSYREREAKPQLEVYMKKQIEGNTVAYKGEFFFLRFRYSIVGVWDKVLGIEKQRLNLFVERMPLAEQTIINSINETRRNNR